MSSDHYIAPLPVNTVTKAMKIFNVAKDVTVKSDELKCNTRMFCKFMDALFPQ